MVKTRIICTLGPASTSESLLRKMIFAGMDVARLNFSHTSPLQLRLALKIIHSLNRKYSRRIGILGDLEGNRIRIGKLPTPILLKKKMTIWLVKGVLPGPGEKVPFDYRGSLAGIRQGQLIFIDDGNICLEVTGKNKNSLETKVIIPGVLKENKGVNMPGAKLDFPAIKSKDIDDIKFCIKNSIDYIAQSFVRSKKDIKEVRKILGKKTKIKIIAKIESREAVENIDEIIDEADGIMIARGDLGISLPIYEIPVIQKMIIKKCNQSAKFVITATQMLESMTENLQPTRAEVSDCANAIFDGTNFVMLSAESAIGKFPLQAVRMMHKIIQFTESYLKLANEK